MLTNFGQLLVEKRTKAGLSLEELAQMTKLTVARLQELERGRGELPSFDICYRLGQAITARSGQMFVTQDLWLALKGDKLTTAENPTIRETKDEGTA